MRFYKIIIYKTVGPDLKRGERVIPDSMEKLRSKKYSYTSVTDDGRAMHSALDLYLDLNVYEAATAREGSAITISGVSREDLVKFNYLQSAEIEVYAGMLDDYLPLARSSKGSDLLMRGTIQWVSSNWEGVNTTLSMIMVPLTALNASLRDVEVPNLVFTWNTGQKLEDAIRQVLEKTYAKTGSNPGGYDLKFEISDDLVWRESVFMTPFTNFGQFAAKIEEVTKKHFPSIQTYTGVRYDGVQLKVFDKQIHISDRSKPPSGRWTKDKPLDLKFTDLIGQPVWKDRFNLVFKTPMRGDLQVWDWVKFPKWLASPYVTTTGGIGQTPNDMGGMGMPSKNLKLFEQPFEIVTVRHLGQFRQADAGSWVTIYTCQPIGKPAEYKGTQAGSTGSPGTEPPPGTEPLAPGSSAGTGTEPPSGTIPTPPSNPTQPLGP